MDYVLKEVSEGAFREIMNQTLLNMNCQSTKSTKHRKVELQFDEPMQKLL